MSRAAMELDFFGMDKQMTASSKSSFKKFLDRRRSFKDIQGAISKINPEIIKSVIASGNQLDSWSKPLSVPYSPKEDQPQISSLPVHVPFSRSDADKNADSAPLTIIYNGTVSVFDVSRDKADSIMKSAIEGYLKKIESTSLIPDEEKKFLLNVDGDLPIARRKSLQRFLKKRKERLTSVSPYSFSDPKHGF